jgi:hypothetical protein
MGMSKKERAIREKRTMEATKKNLMGADGKLGVIAKFLGGKIIRQGSGLFEQGFMSDPYDLPNEDEIPMMTDSDIHKEGYVFDGLSNGMHIEIKYYEADGRLIVDYKGYRVYAEISGDLQGYHPLQEWENLVNTLYKKANERRERLEMLMEPLLESVVLRKRESWLSKMRRKWGL